MDAMMMSNWWSAASIGWNEEKTSLWTQLRLLPRNPILQIANKHHYHEKANKVIFFIQKIIGIFSVYRRWSSSSRKSKRSGYYSTTERKVSGKSHKVFAIKFSNSPSKALRNRGHTNFKRHDFRPKEKSRNPGKLSTWYIPILTQRVRCP